MRPRRTSRAFPSVLVVLAATSCAGPGSSGTPVASEASPRSVSTPKPLQRGRVLGGEKARRTIAWPDARGTDLALRDRFAADVRETLDRSPVPVLAPAEASSGPGDAVTASVGPTWYALTVHGEGYLLHTHGSAEARVHPHVRVTEPTHPMRTDGGFLTRNEEIWSASWIEHGAAYSFEIECDRRVVAWCDDEAEVLRRVEALSYVGTKAGAR